MHANPFATLPAESTSGAQEATRQPRAFALAAGLATLLSIMLGSLVAQLRYPQYAEYLLDNLHSHLPAWCFSILLTALTAALLSRGYLERHGSTLSRPMPLLLGLAIALLVVGQAYGLLAGLLLGGVYQWISDSSLPATLIQELLGLLDFALTCVLPLWLCLRLGAKAPAAAGFVPRHEAALLLALSIALLSLKGLLLVPLYLQEGGWVSLVYFAPLLYGALVFACAWQTLPPRLARIRPGQLVLTALAIFLVWLLVHLLVAGVLLVAAFSGSDALLQPAPLIIAGLAVLALLWPLTLLGLRWIYRAEAA